VYQQVEGGQPMEKFSHCNEDNWSTTKTKIARIITSFVT